MNLMVSGNRPFDRTDPRNAGVVADELVSPASGGAMLRRIVYIDPAEGVEYRYLTTERGRKEERLEATVKKGANFIGTALQRFTVRSLKFLRWVRNFLYREAPWAPAIARLRDVYAAYG